MNIDPSFLSVTLTSCVLFAAAARYPNRPAGQPLYGKRIILCARSAPWRRRRRRTDPPVPAIQLRWCSAVTLSIFCCRAERMRRQATSAVPLTLVCSGGREAVGMLSTPQEEVVGVSFTVCIFNICRVVLWPPALELVCMMSVCQRPFRVYSDIL